MTRQSSVVVDCAIPCCASNWNLALSGVAQMYLQALTLILKEQVKTACIFNGDDVFTGKSHVAKDVARKKDVEEKNCVWDTKMKWLTFPFLS